MATLLTKQTLDNLIARGEVLQGADPSCAEGLKYDFRLGKRFLLPGDRGEVEAGRQSLTIKPGELVFVMTAETLNLPLDLKAELSHKRRLAHEGILVLGGFCVDPGYRGPLIFGLWNWSSVEFPLLQGRKVIAAQFYRLSEGEIPSGAAVPEAIEDWPDDVRKFMLRYKPASPDVLMRDVQQLRQEFEVLRGEFKEKDEWFEKFQGRMDDLRDRVSDIAKELQQEVGQRREGLVRVEQAQVSLSASHQALQTTLTRAEATRSWIMWVMLVVLGAVLAIGVGILVKIF